MQTKKRKTPVLQKRPLKALLSEQGVSQGELARRSGIDRSTVSAYANGRKAIGWPAARKIADALGLPVIPVWALLVGEEVTRGE